MASAVPSTPPATAASRATRSTSAELAAGRTNRLYKSRESDVASMNRITSAELSSAENNAARPNAPTIGGTDSISRTGRARS